MESKPTNPQDPRREITVDQQKEVIERHFALIMDVLGLDRTDDSLRDTPRRVAKMWVDELCCGLRAEEPKVTTFENKMGADQMVLVRDISVMSLCEHHFQTIHGRACLAYIPKAKIVGLSKLNRVVRHFSRRPQVQERLTKQIADFMVKNLETEDVAVFIEAKHYCVIARGIEDQNSETSTSDLRGVFRHEAARAEFFNSVLR